MADDFELSCPLPFSQYDRVVLAHGGGGRVMHRLIDELFAVAFASDDLETSIDGAIVDLGGPVAMTTDAFTVSPLFFPGGDIGRLAVCGTVNDLAMCGARPKHLAVAFVLEEGLALEDLWRIAQSMAAAAREAGVTIVTGDTKVVERGKGDGVYITTTGLGIPLCTSPLAPGAIRPGDAILVSGPVGDHGVAVLSVREGLRFGTELESDVAPVAASVLALIEAGIEPRVLRDPTRGGLATSLCEIAASAGCDMLLNESSLPVRAEVEDACELLGLDPLYVACEGRFVAVVPAEDAQAALACLQAVGDAEAAIIGEVSNERHGRVVLRSPLGSERVLDMLSGEQLPRIC